MKKINIKIPIVASFLILSVLVLLIASMTQIGNPNGGQYAPGKDTYKRFGDGHIQIIWADSNSKFLWDCENQKTLLNPVNSWIKKKNIVFFEGFQNKKHCIIKYTLDDNQISVYEKISF